MSDDQIYKDHLLNNLSEVYETFESLLGSYGKVYIAGGACRDTLLGKAPKDYDVFILNNDYKDNAVKMVAENGVRSKFLSLKNGDIENKTLTGSEKFSCQNLKYIGLDIQIILNGASDIHELFKKFDLNVCCVGYGNINNEVGFIFGNKFPSIEYIKNKTASLHFICIDKDPYISIQRYCYMANKLELQVLKTELDNCIEIIAKAKGWIKDNDVNKTLLQKMATWKWTIGNDRDEMSNWMS